MNKLVADAILNGWLDCIDEAVDKGLIDDVAAEIIFYRSQDHCRSNAKTLGVLDEFEAYAREVSSESDEGQKEMVLN